MCTNAVFTKCTETIENLEKCDLKYDLIFGKCGSRKFSTRASIGSKDKKKGSPSCRVLVFIAYW